MLLGILLEMLLSNSNFPGGSTMASLSWSLDLTGTELSVVSVGVLVTSSCFGDGKVVWVLCGDNDVVLLTPGNQSNFYRVKNYKQSHIIHYKGTSTHAFKFANHPVLNISIAGEI